MKTTDNATAGGRVPRQWHWHHRALLTLRALLQEEHDTRTVALRAPKAEEGDDAVDVANAAQNREELLAELRVEEAELGEIEAALQRIHEGTYGVCAATGQPIARERLRAVPWARFSVGIAARQEKKT